MLRSLRAARGVLRSLRTYHGHSGRAHAMDALYARFIKPHDLVFDIGAHVGDRIRAFRRLGANVVALEPQPALFRTLTVLFGRDDAVTLVPSAVGRVAGTATMMINLDNPTTSTLSRDFIEASRDAEGWEAQTWPQSLPVHVTTLDELIGKYGKPSFIKLDAGLSHCITALSFEFTTIQRPIGLASLERCTALGYTRFCAALGESQRLGEWLSAPDVANWLMTLPHSANSGDIYARRD
jgi:FkbM family methyltransferase